MTLVPTVNVIENVGVDHRMVEGRVEIVVCSGVPPETSILESSLFTPPSRPPAPCQIPMRQLGLQILAGTFDGDVGDGDLDKNRLAGFPSNLKIR